MNTKILHIIDSMGLGGAQTVVKGIFEKQKDNSDIFIYALREREITMKIEHKNLFLNNSKNKFSFPIIKLKKFIKENNISILHCHLAKSQIMGGILKTLFFPNIKLIFHEHGEIFQEGNIYPFLMNIFRKKVDIYFAVSKATKNTILEKTNYKVSQIKVLYNFVDLDKFKKIEKFDLVEERKKYGLLKKDFIIGFASRLYEGKGWKEFIGSAKILIEKGYNLQFVIGGDGEDKEKIENFIHQNNLEKNIRLIGYIDNMVNFYNMIDMFVFPTHRESMGLTQLEAQSCGSLVIASDIEGLNETLNNNKNCLLFESKNKNDLSEKILEIYNNDKLSFKLIDGGLENIKKFSLENYIIELNRNYEEL